MDRFFLELHLTVTSGAYDALGELRLYCWLRAIRFPGVLGDLGTLVVVHPAGAGGELEARQSTIAIEEAASLVARLEELGFPKRRPRVREVFDTSDVWEHVVLRATLDDDTDTLSLSLCASGFEGEDAEGLRAVFRRLLGIAGVAEPGGWYNLTGRR